MSGFLERLGRSCARHPWRTIGAWILVAIVVGTLAASAKGYSESFTIPGTESQQATDLLQDRFPQQAGATAQVVLHSEDGALTDPANTAAIDAALVKVEKLPGVTAVVSPTEAGANGLSKSGDIGYAVVNYAKPGNEIKPADLDRLKAAMAPARDAGIQVEFGGEVARAGERPDLGGTEIYGLIAAMIVLLIAFGSVVAMGVPIGTALVGLAVGLSSVTVLTNFFDISQISTTIATMIGLGVGIDYALFVVTRHREQMAHRHVGARFRRARERHVGHGRRVRRHHGRDRDLRPRRRRHPDRHGHGLLVRDRRRGRRHRGDHAAPRAARARGYEDQQPPAALGEAQAGRGGDAPRQHQAGHVGPVGRARGQQAVALPDRQPGGPPRAGRARAVHAPRSDRRRERCPRRRPSAARTTSSAPASARASTARCCSSPRFPPVAPPHSTRW